MTTLDLIEGYLRQLLSILPEIMVAAAAIATVTPTQTDNRVLNGLIRIVNLLGLNVGRARNADDWPR